MAFVATAFQDGLDGGLEVVVARCNGVRIKLVKGHGVTRSLLQE